MERCVMPTIESLLRIPEAAKLAGVSARKFWQLISTGQSPPVVRIGRCARIRASDFDRWVKSGCPRWERVEAELARGAARCA